MNEEFLEAQALEICEVLFAADSPVSEQAIAELCGENKSLQRRVERLLDCDARARQETRLNEPYELTIDPLPAGVRIADRFTLTRHIGGGGYGNVYEAESEDLAGATVALKILNPVTAAFGEKAIHRFIREAKNAAQLQHPNIVPVFSAGEDEGLYFYAMQLIRGQDLKKYLENNRQTWKELPEDEIQKIVSIALQVARGLDHAHDMGFIHRDIKPANLLIDHGGNAWITDFGLARLRGRSQRDDTLREIAGTLRYMSPEQLSRGRMSIDVHTDIYSLGVTLYELLAGRRAFNAPDSHSLFRSIAIDEPVPLRAINPSLSPDLENIVHQAMAKDPRDRYASAKDLADDLYRFRRGDLVTAGQDNFKMARTSVRLHLQSITESTISMLDRWAMLEPALAESQLSLLQAAMSSFENLIEDKSSRSDCVRIADSGRRVAEILHRLGRPIDALRALEKARKLLVDCSAHSQFEINEWRLLARLDLMKGIVLIDSGNNPEAAETLAECLGNCHLHDSAESYQVDRSNLYVVSAAAHLNKAIIVDNPRDAEGHLREAIAICHRLNSAVPFQGHVDAQLWLALGLYRLGFLLETTGRSEEGDQYYEKVVKILQSLEKASPGLGWSRLLSRRLLSDFVASRNQSDLFRRPELEPLYVLSVEVMKRLSRYKQIPEYRHFLCVRHMAYGQLLLSLKRFSEAARQLNSARQTYEALIREFGDLPEYLEGLAITCLDLADTLSAGGKTANAERMRKNAVELRCKLRTKFPQIPEQALISTPRFN